MMRLTQPRRRAGFTLVEISIVMVIISLIVGGILVGREMIHNSELQNAARDINSYVTALNNFKTKYGYLPGDMPNATLIWGKDNANCSTAAGVAMTDGTCNGNGNGQIMGYDAGDWGEHTRAWQQLALAGLINGHYTGRVTDPLVAGQNAPAMAVGNSTANFRRVTTCGSSGVDVIEIGRSVSGSGGISNSASLTVADTQHLDVVMDDGDPCAGSFRAVGWSAGCPAWNGTSGSYNGNYKDIQCNINYLYQ